MPGPPHYHAPDALRALAVTHDLERELAQQRVERLAEAQLVVALRLDLHARGAAREAEDGVARRELAVDRDAVERALDGDPGEQIERRRRQLGIGLDEAEQGREARRHHPRALRLRGESHRPAAKLHRQAGPLRRPVGRHDRLREGGGVWTELGADEADALEQALAWQHATDHPGRRDPDLLGLDRERRGRRGLRRPRGLEPALAVGDVGVAGGDERRPQAVERRLLRGDDGRAEQCARGEARRRDVQRTVVDEQADVETGGLDPGRDAAGAKARRQRRRLELRDVWRALDPA